MKGLYEKYVPETVRSKVEENKQTILIVLCVIGALAVVAGIAVLVYKLMTPNSDYIEDFDEDEEEEDLFEKESTL